MEDCSFNADLDELTLQALRKGCRKARERVYRAYSRVAWTLALRLYGSEAGAGDAVQEAFILAFTRVAQYRASAGFGFWLRRIVINQVISQQRRDGREVELIEAREGSLREQPDVDMDLEQALLALEDLDRQIVWLYDVEGMTHAEISELHGQSLSWSKSRLSRARARLRQLLSKEFLSGQTTGREEK